MMTILIRNLIALIFCSSALLFCRCSDDNAPVFTPGVESVRFFEDGVILSPVAGKQTISFTTSEGWMVSMAEPSVQSPGWCTVSPMRGTAGNASITISASENTGYDDRSTVITLTAGELQMTIAVTQKQTDAIIISRKSYVLSSEARTIQVDLSSNIDHQVMIPEAGNWITQVSTTKALIDSKLQFSVQANEALNTRSGMIIIKDPKTTLADTVTVMQTGKSAVMDEGITGTLKWTLFENGTLILSGNGSMPDYARAPWEDYSSLITTVIIEDGLTSVGNNAFTGLSSLNAIMIPDGVTSIGMWAFTGCSSLTSITFPSSVTSIEKWAFGGCSRLTEIMISNSIQRIGPGAFYNCNQLNEFVVAPDNPNYSSDNGILFDKNQTMLVAYPGGKPGPYTIPNSITGIFDYAFYGCNRLMSIIIPNNVSLIGTYAFAACNGLTSFTIPNSVTWIGESILLACQNISSISIDMATVPTYFVNNSLTNLSSITIGNNTTSIDKGAFYGLSRVTSITIGNNVQSIGQSAFEGCSGLTVVNIPENVISIGPSAFVGCSSLTSVTIGNGVKSIGQNAFVGCSGLTSIIIPNNVRWIADNTFVGCSGLTSVTIGNGVKGILSRAFDSCSSLTSITIPNSVENIEDGAFVNCTKLNEFVVVSDNTNYSSANGVLFDKNQTTLVAYPSGKPGSCIVPNSVTSIAGLAFENCGLITSITIGKSVQNIVWGAFYGCSSLAEVHVKATTPPSIENPYVFSGTPANKKLYVPEGCKSAYQSSDWGAYFDTIIEE